MRWRTQIRVAPGAWLTPFLIVVIVAYVAQTITFAPREPSSLALTARAMNALGLIVPPFAAAAAWEGSRLRQSGVWSVVFPRRRTVVAAWALAPAALGGVVVIVIAALQVLIHEQVWVPDGVVLLVAASILIAHLAAGFVAGLMLSRSIAVPGTLLVSFLWFVVPRIVPDRSFRFMSGTGLELCCQPFEVLASSVVLAALLTAAGVTIACGVLIAGDRLGARRAIASASVVVVCILAAWASVASRTSAADPRHEIASVCHGDDTVRVCLWPEHRTELERAAGVASAVTRRWRSADIPVPAVFREGVVPRGEDGVSMRFYARQPESRLIGWMADAMIPGPPECATSEPWLGGGAEPYLWVWLASAAGLPAEWIDLRYEDDMVPDPDLFPLRGELALVPVRPLVSEVLQQPAEDQAMWVRANIEAMRVCDQPPVLVVP